MIKSNTTPSSLLHTHTHTHLGLRDKLSLPHGLPRCEAAGSLLVHLGARGHPVDRHVQHPPGPHDVRDDAVDVVKDAQYDVSLAQLLSPEAKVVPLTTKTLTDKHFQSEGHPRRLRQS